MAFCSWAICVRLLEPQWSRSGMGTWVQYSGGFGTNRLVSRNESSVQRSVDFTINISTTAIVGDPPWTRLSVLAWGVLQWDREAWSEVPLAWRSGPRAAICAATVHEEEWQQGQHYWPPMTTNYLLTFAIRCYKHLLAIVINRYCSPFAFLNHWPLPAISCWQCFTMVCSSVVKQLKHFNKCFRFILIHDQIIILVYGYPGYPWLISVGYWLKWYVISQMIFTSYQQLHSGQQQDGEAIDLAFNKKRADDRKENAALKRWARQFETDRSSGSAGCIMRFPWESRTWGW